MKQPTLEDRDLQSLWLDALKVLKEAGFGDSHKLVYLQTSVQWCDRDILPVATFTYGEGDLMELRKVKVLVSPSLEYTAPYHVERVEVLTYVAAECLRHLMKWTPQEMKGLCRQLGCANSRLSTARERWRLIGVEQKSAPLASLASKMYEDRPKCGWCSGPIATGSADAVRQDLHVGCIQYLKEVVRPQLLAAREAEKRAYTAEIDK